MGLLRGFKHKQDGYGERYTEYLAKRTRLGEWFLIRKIIPNTLAKCRGKIVDFGCGVGDILKQSPPGSIGFDISPSNVEYCRNRGLDVRAYDPIADDYQLTALEPGSFGTLLMSHVLEHLADTANVLRKLLASCHRLGFERIVIKVPGAFGYKQDDTHVTFVDRAWLHDNQLVDCLGWNVAEISYYPFNAEWVGRYSIVHETIIVYAPVRPAT